MGIKQLLGFDGASSKTCLLISNNDVQIATPQYVMDVVLILMSGYHKSLMSYDPMILKYK